MDHSPATAPPSPPRRGFLAALGSIVIGGLITLTPLVSGVVFFLDPILRRRPNFKGGDAQGYLPVTTLKDLPDDGTPVRFGIVADKYDAWNLDKNKTIGSVYLRKMPENQVIAFNDTCPHLGCKVEYQAGNHSFLCPCHASAFQLDGAATNKIPPRGLDTLEAKTDAEGRVWVKYQEFQGGIEQKKEV